MTAKEKFKLGDAVVTRHRGHLLKGEDGRIGEIVGFCKDPGYARVCWSGWKKPSSVAVNIDHLAMLADHIDMMW
jgi:hypothetical protein